MLKDISTLFNDYLYEQNSCLEEILKNDSSINNIINILIDARNSGKKIFTFGNGGSASTASHFVSDLLKTSDLKKKILSFEINSKRTIFLVSIKKDLKTSEIESLGAKFHSYINYDKENYYFVGV